VPLFQDEDRSSHQSKKRLYRIILVQKDITSDVQKVFFVIFTFWRIEFCLNCCAFGWKARNSRNHAGWGWDSKKITRTTPQFL